MHRIGVSLSLALHAMASGTLVFFICFSTVLPPLGFMVHLTEVYLFQIISQHDIISLGKQSLQLGKHVLRQPVIFWELNLECNKHNF